MKKLSSITFSFIPHQDSHLVEMGKKLRDGYRGLVYLARIKRFFQVSKLSLINSCYIRDSIYDYLLAKSFGYYTDPEDPILTSKLLIARPFRMWTHIFMD